MSGPVTILKAIQSGKTVSQIAYELGYQYSQHFNRVFKKKTAYEIMSGDWSSDVCSSDLPRRQNSDVYRNIG